MEKIYLFLLPFFLAGCASDSDIAALDGSSAENILPFMHPQPKFVKCAGRSGVRLNYEHFIINAPFQGAWICLKDAKDCALLRNGTFGSKPWMELTAVCASFSDFPATTIVDANTGVTNTQQLIRIQEFCLNSLEKALRNGLSAAIFKSDFTGLENSKDPLLKMPYRVRSKSIEPDAFVTSLGIRTKEIFEPAKQSEAHEAQTVFFYESVFFVLPDNPRLFVKAEVYRTEIEGKSNPALDQIAQDFLNITLKK